MALALAAAAAPMAVADVAAQTLVWEPMGSNLSDLADSVFIDGRRGSSAIALSADGTTVVVGSNYDEQVTVSRFDGTEWVQIGSTLSGDGIDREPEGFGSSVDISADGSTIIVGAPLGNDLSYVRAYRFQGDDWVELGGYVTTGGNGEYAGASVALSADGTIAAVGVPGVDNADGGWVEVLQLVGDEWIPVGEIIDGPGDFFGQDLDLSADGTTVAIGSIGSFDLEVGAGAVHLYTFDGSGWILDEPVLGNGQQYFGFSVELDDAGTTLVAATGQFEDGVGVFTDGPDGWSLAAAADVGASLALSGDGAVVARTNSLVDNPSISIFSFDGTSLTPLGEDIPVETSGVRFGSDVALSYDGTVVAGLAPSQAFRLTDDPDTDRDGVPNSIDACPDTVLPDTPERGPVANRYIATEKGFVSTDGAVVYGLADTGGCSGAQIAEALGLNRSERLLGVTKSSLDRWIESQ